MLVLNVAPSFENPTSVSQRSTNWGMIEVLGRRSPKGTGTKLGGGGYPPSDDRVSRLMDLQVKPGAAVRRLQAEVCRLPLLGMIYSTKNLYIG